MRKFDPNFKQQMWIGILAAGCARALWVAVPQK